MGFGETAALLRSRLLERSIFIHASHNAITFAILRQWRLMVATGKVDDVELELIIYVVDTGVAALEKGTEISPREFSIIHSMRHAN